MRTGWRRRPRSPGHRWRPAKAGHSGGAHGGGVARAVPAYQVPMRAARPPERVPSGNRGESCGVSGVRVRGVSVKGVPPGGASVRIDRDPRSRRASSRDRDKPPGILDFRVDGSAWSACRFDHRLSGAPFTLPLRWCRFGCPRGSRGVQHWVGSSPSCSPRAAAGRFLPGLRAPRLACPFSRFVSVGVSAEWDRDHAAASPTPKAGPHGKALGSGADASALTITLATDREAVSFKARATSVPVPSAVPPS